MNVRAVSFHPETVSLRRDISNPDNKKDNKYMSQSPEEYSNNVSGAIAGTLPDRGKGPEFDPDNLAEEIRNHCAKGDEGYCDKVLQYISSIFNFKQGGGRKKKTRKSNYKNGTTKKRILKRKKTLKK